VSIKKATEQDRTADLTITNRLLFHLSYGGLIRFSNLCFSVFLASKFLKANQRIGCPPQTRLWRIADKSSLSAAPNRIFRGTTPAFLTAQQIVGQDPRDPDIVQSTNCDIFFIESLRESME
jgi:hypothetical protein